MALVLNGSGITSANIADGTIVNADINSSAAIDGTKVDGSFGKVLQVVNMTTSSATSSSTSTWIGTPITLAITPSSTSSKILVIVNIVGIMKTGNSYMGLQLLRDSATLRGIETQAAYTGGGTSENSIGGTGISFLDSPSTTSAISYNIQMRSTGNNPTVKINYSGASSITLMEIGA